VIALGTESDSVVCLERDPESGRLKRISEFSAGSVVHPGAAGIAFSADGKHCYIADEKSAEIVTMTISDE
jgi:6-phosphogluconolactonase (cycloisomerase 2 family)